MRPRIIVHGVNPEYLPDRPADVTYYMRGRQSYERRDKTCGSSRLTGVVRPWYSAGRARDRGDQPDNLFRSRTPLNLFP